MRCDGTLCSFYVSVCLYVLHSSDNGVLTIQRLIGDFILSDSGAAESGYHVAESGVSFSSFPTFAYEESGFFGDIGGQFLHNSTAFLLVLRYN